MIEYERLLIDIGIVVERQIGRRIDELRDEMNKRFEQMEQRFEQMEQRFEQMEQRFQQIDEKLKQIDKELKLVDERFKETNREIALMKEDMQNGFDMLNTAVQTSDSYYNEICPRIDKLEQNDDILIGRVNLLEDKILRIQ